ncbi:MAG: hypothetical protein ABIJ96_18505 [Elusimicrobiota bacterium]
MIRPSKIECSKCREPATLTDLHCPKCRGRVVKHCGSCGWVLSVLKKYCDSCGEPQEVVSNTPMPRQLPPAAEQKPKEPPQKTPPPKAKKEAPKKDDGGINLSLPKEEPKLPRSLSDGAKKPPQDIPHTIMRRLDEAPRDAAPAREKARERSAPREREKDQPRIEYRDPPREQQRPRRSRSDRGRTAVHTLVRERPVFSTLLGLILLLATAGAYFTVWKSRRTPQRLLLKTTSAYLAALKAKRYDAAYQILSTEARDSCTLERFSTLQEPQSWNYDKIRIVSISPERALVQYELLTSGRTMENDWLYFYNENGKWRRTYWWHLMPEIEEALETENAAGAFALAEKAARINPLDPMPPSYLCEAAYAQSGYAAAETYCRRALDMAAVYPSRLGAEGMLRLRLILADTYRNGLGDITKAVQQYDQILADPLMRGKKHCDVRLANADARYLLGDYEQASEQFRAAGEDCRQEEEIAYVQRTSRMLTGKADAEAVAAAQEYHMPGDKLSLLQWRQKSRREVSKRFGTKLIKYRDEESWEARHLSGANYEVVVRNQSGEVLTAQVDLWTQNVKVKIHVQ